MRLVVKGEMSMRETYKYLSMYTSKEFLKKTNEELVDIYKSTHSEYEKSQSFSSLFVNNFLMLLKISNRFTHIDSVDKAEMISEELIKTIESYDGSVKFITYMTTRIGKLFLWDACKNKKEIEIYRNMLSFDEDIDIDGEMCTFQVEDTNMTNNVELVEFKITIDRLIDREIDKCNLQTVSGKSYKRKLEYARKIIDMLFEDDKMSADQIARELKWYKLDKQGHIKYVEKPRNPDYVRVKTDDGIQVVEQTRVIDSSWGKVNKITRLIKDLFRKYEIV